MKLVGSSGVGSDGICELGSAGLSYIIRFRSVMIRKTPGFVTSGLKGRYRSRQWVLEPGEKIKPRVFSISPARNACDSSSGDQIDEPRRVALILEPRDSFPNQVHLHPVRTGSL